MTDLKAKRDATVDVWTQEYPTEPYWPPNKEDYEVMTEGAPTSDQFVSSFSYDIISAALRQKLFYYQVRKPNY